MVKAVIGRVVILVAIVGLVGCTLPPPSGQSVSVISSQQVFGRVEPVYNPPPGTPFRCVEDGLSVTMSRVPGDLNTPLPVTDSPLATLGYRRGDWLEVVARTGVIGWIYLPVEKPISQSKIIKWCRVYQDAQGRLVFDYKYWPYQF